MFKKSAATISTSCRSLSDKQLRGYLRKIANDNVSKKESAILNVVGISKNEFEDQINSWEYNPRLNSTNWYTDIQNNFHFRGLVLKARVILAKKGCLKPRFFYDDSCQGFSGALLHHNKAKQYNDSVFIFPVADNFKSIKSNSDLILHNAQSKLEVELAFKDVQSYFEFVFNKLAVGWHYADLLKMFILLNMNSGVENCTEFQSFCDALDERSSIHALTYLDSLENPIHPRVLYNDRLSNFASNYQLFKSALDKAHKKRAP